MLWHQYILIAFIVTIVSELLIIKYFLLKEEILKYAILIVVLVHFISHPFATVLFYFLGVSFVAVELIVILIESALYKIFTKKNSLKIFIIVFLANTISILAGIFLRNLLSISVYLQ